MRNFERCGWLPMAGLGLVMGALLLSESLIAAFGVASLFLLFAWWMFPWRGGTVKHDRLTGGEAVVVYWRPGCMFCTRLRRALLRHRDRVVWINIWRDPAAGSFVRSVNDGNEIVPTVVLDGQVLTNPAPSRVLARLTERRD